MNGLLRKIDEAGQRTETLLRAAAESIKSAESALQGQFRKKGLVNETESDDGD
jgi:hypothetical protein